MCKAVVYIAALFLVAVSFSSAEAGEANIDKTVARWVDFFTPSGLSKEDAAKELLWFHEAAKPFEGKEIRVAAEDIETHYWERDVLAQAFREITGIAVKFDVIPEGDIILNITEQMMTGRMIYDAYVNDADLIGTHTRLGKVVNLTEYMAGEGKPYTDPWLDLPDFLNLEFGQDYDGNQLQLPDQQFPILYWFRYDWFNDEETKRDFRKRYGYELGVPVNWSAYEDIAEFFTGRTMKNPNGSTVKAYGHLDYGKPSPSLGWRFTDAWLSVAGMGDKGLPNGRPVDEWGIRVEDRVPVGSMVERGGQLNGPAAVYGLTKYIEWMDKYAPPYAKNIEWSEFGPIPGEGAIAQTIYFCGTFASYPGYHKAGSPVCDSNGNPLWRVAPQPHGVYWEEGMKVGYQDAGSWTIPSNVRGKQRAMAWLFAQFCVSKTVSVKKFIIGGTPNRRSTVEHPYIMKNASRWGGLVEFYSSRDEKTFTGTGLNVPNYPALSGLWWEHIAAAVKGEYTPQQAMDTLAAEQDELMGSMKFTRYSPKLNPVMSKEYWLERPDGPKAKRPEREKPVTIAYDDILKGWGMR
jgi:glycerol transport system substrate-binding protein